MRTEWQLCGETVGTLPLWSFSDESLKLPEVSSYPSGEERLVGLVDAGRLAGCQELRLAFQALGVSSATRVMGQVPRRGRMSLR